MFVSGSILFQSSSRFENLLQTESCAYWDHKHPIPDAQETNRSLSVPNLEVFQWTQFREWKAYQKYKCGIVSLERIHTQMLMEIFSAQEASVIIWFILAHPVLPERSFPARFFVFEDNEAVFCTIIFGRNPQPKHVSRTTVSTSIGCMRESIWTTRSMWAHHRTVVRHEDQRGIHNPAGFLEAIVWHSPTAQNGRQSQHYRIIFFCSNFVCFFERLEFTAGLRERVLG